MLTIKTKNLIVLFFILSLVFITGCEQVVDTLDPEKNKNRGLVNEGLKYYQSDNTKNRIIGLKNYFAKASDKQSLSYIIKALNDKDSQVRTAAMVVLATREGSASSEYLVKKLSDNDRTVVNTAHTLIKELGIDVAPKLEEQLSSSNFVEKVNTIKAMGIVRDPGFTDSLGRIAIDDRDFRLRIEALNSLSRINTPEANLYVYKGLVDRVPKVKIAALENLKKDKGVKLVKDVTPLLQDKDEEVVITAIKTLAENQNTRAIQPLINKLTFSASSNKVIDEITKALSDLGRNNVVELYLDALNSRKQYVRFAIIKAAVDAPPSYWTEQVIVKAAQNDEPEIKSMALFALKRAGSKASLSTIIQSLDDYDASVRLSAVKSLAAMPEASQNKHKIVPMFQDEDFKVRIAAVQSLSKIHADWVFDELKLIIETNPDENMVLAAITALSQSKDERSAVRCLSKAVKSNNDTISFAACNALVTIGTPLARKELIKNLKSTNKRVVINSLMGLEKFGDSSAIGAIQRLQDDPDPKVRKQVAQTLHVLSLKKSIRKTKKYKYAQQNN